MQCCIQIRVTMLFDPCIRIRDLGDPLFRIPDLGSPLPIGDRASEIRDSPTHISKGLVTIFG